MRKIWLILGLIVFSILAIAFIAANAQITVNNRFVLYVLIACIDVAVLIVVFMQRNLLRHLVVSIVAMSAFAFILVPLYNVFCEVTGLNGKVDLSIAAATAKNIDLSRKVTVEFVVTQNHSMPWEFKAKHHTMVLHPGQLATTAYFAKNLTDATMYAQAIPSITPSTARKYFKKVECFCFNKQKLRPGEAAHLGLRFYLDPAIPKDIQRVTLAY
ncbi:MAG TPA: cytochrome c oxidase assembly protein, partial [Gammaproteobacteria bacterium]|nr:cytochrome c oxidase assembly protein [Gammaproteobacteria bacterium]